MSSLLSLKSLGSLLKGSDPELNLDDRGASVDNVASPVDRKLKPMQEESARSKNNGNISSDKSVESSSDSTINSTIQSSSPRHSVVTTKNQRASIGDSPKSKENAIPHPTLKHRVPSTSTGPVKRKNVEIEQDDSMHDDGSSQFTGLNKEELKKYCDDPYWVRLRTIFISLFWLIWFVMMFTTILLTVFATKCPKPPPEKKWWAENIMYEIYILSFKDSGADGYGDIKGIVSKLNYFKDLGVKSILLEGWFASECEVDCRDVTNLTDLHESVGNIKDVKNLLDQAEQRDIRVLLRFIPNHTSHLHPWFKKSRQGDGDYKDYYIWEDGTTVDGKHQPPNDWKTLDGNRSAWEYDSQRGQFYYFTESPMMPDLNLKNKEVVDELVKALEYWLNLSIFGIYIDNLQNLVELNSDGDRVSDHKENAKIIKRFRKLMNENRPAFLSEHAKASLAGVLPKEMDRLIFGDLEGTSEIERKIYYKDDGLDFGTGMTFQNYTNDCLRSCISDMVQANIKFAGSHLQTWQSGNCLTTRLATRLQNKTDVAIIGLQLLLPGVPATYYGEEIGMQNYESGEKETYYTKSPMQWSYTKSAGFSTVDPWYPVNPSYRTLNVKTQAGIGAGRSSIAIYKKLATYRSQVKAFIYGSFTELFLPQEYVYAFTRVIENLDGYLVAVNVGNIDVTVDFYSNNKNTIPAEGIYNYSSGEFDLEPGTVTKLDNIFIESGVIHIFKLIKKDQL